MTEDKITDFLDYLKTELCNLAYLKLPQQEFIRRVRTNYECLLSYFNDTQRTSIENLLNEAVHYKHPQHVVEHVILIMLHEFSVDSIVPDSLPKVLAKDLNSSRFYWTNKKDKYVLKKSKLGYSIYSKDQNYWVHFEDELLATEIMLRMLRAGVEVITDLEVEQDKIRHD